MGGSKKAKKPEGYDERQAEIARTNLTNEGQMRTLMYNSGRSARVAWAQNKMMTQVNDEMTEAMTNAQKTISGYEGQERRRLFDAKKGSGQVSDSDTAITLEDYEAAQKTISGGSSAWDERRSQAMNVGGGGWDGQHGSLEDYIAKGSLATEAREAGAGYSGGESSTTLGSSDAKSINDRFYRQR